MRRGVESHTALPIPLQTQVILSEGLRMNRKCSRLKPYLAAYGDFLIEFVTNLKPQRCHIPTLIRRFHVAVTKVFPGSGFDPAGFDPDPVI